MSSARPAGGGSGHIHRHRCRCWRRKHTSAGPPSLTDYTLFSEVSTLAGEDRTSNDDLFQWLSLQLVRVSLCTRFSCKCDVQAAFLWETWRHWKTSLTLASQLTELAAVSLSWIEQHVIAPVSLAVLSKMCFHLLVHTSSYTYAEPFRTRCRLFFTRKVSSSGLLYTEDVGVSCVGASCLRGSTQTEKGFIVRPLSRR